MSVSAIPRNRTLAITREILHPKERRAPLTPKEVAELVKQGYRVVVQISPNRIFEAKAYQAAGAEIVPEIKGMADFNFGVKQIHPAMFEGGKVYVMFPHVIKGQLHGMEMLHAALESKAILVDYERMGYVNESGMFIRTVAFGREAGIAGINDSLLQLLFLRLAAQGHKELPVRAMKQAINCPGGLEEIKAQAREAAARIKRYGMPKSAGPLVVGVLGYGRVSKGALEVLDAMNPIRLTPQELLEKQKAGTLSRRKVYVVVFEEKDTVVPTDPSREFDLDDYHNNPLAYELYTSNMEQYLPLMTVLVNGILWFPRQPRLVTREMLKNVYCMGPASRLQVISDIGADQNGPIASTVIVTNADAPYLIYNPITGEATMGYIGDGIACNNNDTLPCEIPEEASKRFGQCLLPYIPGMLEGNWVDRFETSSLSWPEHIRTAVIAMNGNLVGEYADNLDIRRGLEEYRSHPELYPFGHFR